MSLRSGSACSSSSLALFALSSLARTGPNEVGVVYNGGPLDKKTQRQLIPPASGLTWTGWLSQDPRLYPVGGLAAALHHHEHARAR